MSCCGLNLLNIGSKFKMTEEIYYHQISLVCVLLETQKINEGESQTDKSH